ncbi:MAG: two pore domain potassium channel family protein [Bacteroidales bacterium]|nr:two pore domain potassium channel family protein [Bacteroidales bacterium]
MSNTSLIELNSLIRSGVDRKKILLRTNLILFGALFMIIFIVPVIPIKDHYLTTMLLSIVVASGLFAADFSRTAFRILFTIGTMVIMVTLINLFLPDLKYLNVITFGLNTLFFIVVTIALVAHVAMAREVYGSTLLCAINSYLLIGLTLSMLFLIIDIYFPGSFNQVKSGEGSFSTFVYYGFITLTTLGYGDITPDTSLARSLSTFTALFGQLYLVIIMALIIGKYLIVNEPGK